MGNDKKSKMWYSTIHRYFGGLFMVTKKKTSTRRKSSYKKTNRKPSVQEVRQVEAYRMEIIMWIIIACSLLLFICNFGIGGIVGDIVSGLLFGTFGTVAYVFPLILCSFYFLNMFCIFKLLFISNFNCFVCPGNPS